MLKKREYRKTIRKIKWKNLIILIILLLFTIFLCFSIINILISNNENKKINNQYDRIKKIVNIKEIKITKDNKDDKNNMYIDYMKMNLIDVDFNKLKKINNDVKGWINVTSTNINYPFVQANDNKYYLTHSFDKSYNKAGWVFLDYRNYINKDQKNIILYAHGRVDKTMFGSLKDTLKSKWLNNSNNHYIKMSTNLDNTLWKVFSVYKLPTTSDYLQIDFDTNKEFLLFINKLKDRSIIDFNTTINQNDKIITLSTCYNSKEKVVMHAKLIEKLKKQDF